MCAKALIFDAANTLLHKPALYPAIAGVLATRGIDIPLDILAARHRLVSEVVLFPDTTSQDFYREFNAHFLRSIGVASNPELLDALFAGCTYLPWAPFDDTAALTGITLPMGVLSNWDSSLGDKLASIEGVRFEWMLGSAEVGVRKPDPRFFAKAVTATGVAASDIVYVGDSIRLDIEPALRAGMQAILVDRDNLFVNGNVPRIDSLDQLTAYL
jgi:HAD superfamily hydrolase (TIGR01493 family)